MNPQPLPAQPGDDRRTQGDRRLQPTSPWGALPPAGQRRQLRRAAEHRQAYFVDRFSPMLFVLLLALLLASIVDAALTIQVVAAGGHEINPLMERLLAQGELPFLIGKYILTAIGLPLLLIFKNYYLFGTRFRVAYLIPAIVAMYAILISYQLVLMQKCMGP